MVYTSSDLKLMYQMSLIEVDLFIQVKNKNEFLSIGSDMNNLLSKKRVKTHQHAPL